MKYSKKRYFALLKDKATFTPCMPYSTYNELTKPDLISSTQFIV